MSVKKLDYNGLQTLIQTIKSFFLYRIKDYLSLSGGTMTGNILYTPIEGSNSEGFTGCCAVSKYGTKGIIPSTEEWFTYYVGRDTSNLNSNDDICRYGIFEVNVGPTGCKTTIACYKNEANSSANSKIDVVYPNSGDPYIEMSSKLKLQSGIML